MLKEIKNLISFLNKNNFIKEAKYLEKKAEELCEPPFTEADAAEIKRGKRLYLGDKDRAIGYCKTILSELLYYNGNIDCNFDQELSFAIKDFEKDNDISYDGTISMGTIFVLGIAFGFKAKNTKRYFKTKKSKDSLDPSEITEYPEWNKFTVLQVPNFNKAYGKNNYRSAQVPKEKEFFEFLNYKYGIENIVNLTTNYSEEEKAVKDAGLNYLSVQLGARPPSDTDWQDIKYLLEQGNTLVHCTHGADRTGAIIARWEVEKKIKSPIQAYEDSLKYGFKDENFAGYKFDAEGNPTDPDPNKHLREYIIRG